MSEDPIGLAGGDVNFNRYVLNDPVNWVDPEGLQTYFEPGGGPNGPSVPTQPYNREKPTALPNSPCIGSCSPGDPNSNDKFDDFNKSMEGKAQQMADWLYWEYQLPTTGQFLLYPFPPMGGAWRDVPPWTIECHGNW